MDWFKDHATAAELERMLGRNWAICRKTARNLARYDRCLTQSEFKAAERVALQSRDNPPDAS